MIVIISWVVMFLAVALGLKLLSETNGEPDALLFPLIVGAFLLVFSGWVTGLG